MSSLFLAAILATCIVLLQNNKPIKSEKYVEEVKAIKSLKHYLLEQVINGKLYVENPGAYWVWGLVVPIHRETRSAFVRRLPAAI